MIFGNGIRKWKLVFWTAEEIDLSQDLNDGITNLMKRRYFVKHILAFCCFGWNCKFGRNFVNEVQYAEAKFFMAFKS
jgi:ribonucleoside-diphosphate reductase beta chain